MDSLIGPVPESWRHQRLDECCQLQPGPGGSTLRSVDRVSDGIPVVNARDIGAGRIKPMPAFSVSSPTAERLQRYRLVEGDIVLPRIGDPTRHAVIRKAQAGWLMGGSCIRIRTRGLVTPAYLSCYLSHPSVQDWIAQHIRGSVIATINSGTIAALPLVLPPVEIQQAIVNVVEAIESKIHVHEEIARITKALRDLLLPHLISGQLSTSDGGKSS